MFHRTLALNCETVVKSRHRTADVGLASAGCETEAATPNIRRLGQELRPGFAVNAVSDEINTVTFWLSRNPCFLCGHGLLPQLCVQPHLEALSVLYHSSSRAHYCGKITTGSSHSVRQRSHGKALRPTMRNFEEIHTAAGFITTVRKSGSPEPRTSIYHFRPG